MIRGVTREEIQQTLIGLIRKEKEIPDGLLTPETGLAEAGIDSLDSLTILFAIEEEFGISIPDDRARAMKTFGDMVDLVSDLVRDRG
jgi:acyl carrier protein